MTISSLIGEMVDLSGDNIDLIYNIDSDVEAPTSQAVYKVSSLADRPQFAVSLIPQNGTSQLLLNYYYNEYNSESEYRIHREEVYLGP